MPLVEEFGKQTVETEQSILAATRLLLRSVIRKRRLFVTQ